MPRKLVLTWQPGAANRPGRWRKKYRGKVYFFPGGRGKTDKEAYEKAVKAWGEKKTELDAGEPKPNQAAYEVAIREWEQVRQWSREHGEPSMEAVATSKLGELRDQLARPKPKAIALADTFRGQFAAEVRLPPVRQTIFFGDDQGQPADESAPVSQPRGDAKGLLAIERELWKGLEESGFTNGPTILPGVAELGRTVLEQEEAIWDDRLSVAQRAAVAKDRTVRAHAESFVREKSVAADAGQLSAGWVYALKISLDQFVNWFGGDSPVEAIDGKRISEYRLELLGKVARKKCSLATARDRFSAVKTFLRWLWHVEAIPSLPRILDGSALSVAMTPTKVVTLSKEEIRTLLVAASDRTQLFILLALNCGMTQRDISDLKSAEVDWKAGRITRKRSKTRKHDAVPEVSYPLWQRTLSLLSQESHPNENGQVLVNANGSPLWSESYTQGSLRKTDNVRNAYERVCRKTGVKKPFKCLKKTSATLIRGSGQFSSLERLFLGHAPNSMSDRHYTQAPQQLFDAAILWLGKEYGLNSAVGE